MSLHTVLFHSLWWGWCGEKKEVVQQMCISWFSVSESESLKNLKDVGLLQKTKDFSNESSVGIRWPKYWSFSFRISPSNEYSGLISLKIELFDLAVQGNFRSLLQSHSSKATILQHSTFFTIQLSQLYVTIGKTIALTTWTFVGRVMFRFSTYCLGFSSLSCQEAILFWFHGCSHHLQWFWSPQRGNLSLLPPFPLLFAMQWWDHCYDLSFFNI